jgi:hypothetical protein
MVYCLSDFERTPILKDAVFPRINELALQSLLVKFERFSHNIRSWQDLKNDK